MLWEGVVQLGGWVIVLLGDGGSCNVVTLCCVCDALILWTVGDGRFV